MARGSAHRSRPTKQRPKGRWAAYWRDSLNVQHSKSLDFKHEAQRFLDGLVVERSVGMDHDPKAERITVADLAKRWRTSGSRGSKLFKPATVRGYDSVLKTHVLPTFGRAYIGSVTRDDVEDWVVGLMARDLMPSTVRNCCFVLRSMYRYALHPSRRWVRATHATACCCPRQPRRKFAHCDPATWLPWPMPLVTGTARWSTSRRTPGCGLVNSAGYGCGI